MAIPEPDVFANLSEVSIQDLLLAENSHAANLRKQILQLLILWNEHMAIAALCQYLLDNKGQFNIRPTHGFPHVIDGLLPEAK